MPVAINSSKKVSFKNNLFIFDGSDLSPAEAIATQQNSVVMLQSERTGSKIAFLMVNSGEFLKEDGGEGYEYEFQGMGEMSHLKMKVQW